MKLMRRIRRVRVGVETQLSQLVQGTRLEAFRQSRVVVVVVVVVVVEAYSFITGNRVRQLRGRMSHDDVGPMNPVVEQSGPTY